MQGDSSPEEQGRQQVFKGMDAFLQENTHRDKRECEEIGFQKMDGIDLAASMQQVHEAVERKSRKKGKAHALPPVIGNVLLNCQIEREIHCDPDKVRDE